MLSVVGVASVPIGIVKLDTTGRLDSPQVRFKWSTISSGIGVSESDANPQAEKPQEGAREGWP